MSDTTRCREECISEALSCENKNCRHWIEYDQDYNCSLIAIGKNGAMTLDEISKRLGLSLVRIKQIEEAALNKVKKRNNQLIKELLHE